MKIYCAFLIVLILVYFAVSVEIKAGVDLLKLSGKLGVYISGIRVMQVGFKVVKTDEDCARIIYGNAKKNRFLRLNSDKNDQKSVAWLFGIGFVPYLDLVSIECVGKIGKADDAMQSMVLIQLVRTAFYLFASKLKTAQMIKVDEDFSYSGDTFRISLSFTIRASLVSLAVDVVRYLTAKNRKLKEE